MKPLASILASAEAALGALPEPTTVPRQICPALPERYRGIRWDNLAQLCNPVGEASLGGVMGPRGYLGGAEAVTEIRRRIAGRPRVVFVGETRCGKTIAACAALREACDVDGCRARFLAETDLALPGAVGFAASADVLVLDNVGWALHGAPAGSPLAAQRRAPLCDLVDHLSLRRFGSCRMIVTTWLDEEAMGLAYDGGVVTRIYEGAEVIRIVRPEVSR